MGNEALASPPSGRKRIKTHLPPDRRIDSIPWWGIIVIILLIILIVILISYILQTREKDEVIAESYLMIWMDDFTMDECDMNLDLDLDDDLNLDDTDDRIVRYPNINRWTIQSTDVSSPSTVDDEVFFSTDIENSFVRKDLLHLNIFNQLTELTQNGYRKVFTISSSRLVSRVGTAHGFFNLRVKLPSEPGIKVNISLIPFRNICMNVVDPCKGIIKLLELSTDDGWWRGSASFGRGQYPRDDRIVKLNLNKWHVIGLEWTPQCLTWMQNGAVVSTTDGLNKIVGDELRTVSLEDVSTGLNNIDDSFSGAHHLVIEMTSRNRMMDSTMLVDWVKLFKKT